MYEKNVINYRLSKGIYKQLYKKICKIIKTSITSCQEKINSK